MDATTARRTVVETLADIAPEGDFDALDPVDSLREQLDLDSLDFLVYVEKLAERTGVEVREEDYPQVDGLDSCVAFLTGAAAGR